MVYIQFGNARDERLSAHYLQADVLKDVLKVANRLAQRGVFALDAVDARGFRRVAVMLRCVRLVHVSK